MKIVLFCFRVLNDSASHTKHENLPECGLYNAKSRTYATTYITTPATWKVKQPSLSSSWWQPLCSFWVSRNKYWLILQKINNNNINIFYYWTNFSVKTAIFHTDCPNCAIAHGSRTVGTATFNSHKTVSKTHFNIILSFPSKLRIYDTYNFLQHAKC